MFFLMLSTTRRKSPTSTTYDDSWHLFSTLEPADVKHVLRASTVTVGACRHKPAAGMSRNLFTEVLHIEEQINNLILTRTRKVTRCLFEVTICGHLVDCVCPSVRLSVCPSVRLSLPLHDGAPRLLCLRVSVRRCLLCL